VDDAMLPADLRMSAEQRQHLLFCSQPDR